MMPEYYLTCKTCGWEEWVLEPQWLRKSLDHMDAVPGNIRGLFK